MTATLSLDVEDFTSQTRRRAPNVPGDVTVGDFISAVTKELQLAELDADHRPIIYGARTGQGDVLNPGDLVGEVLRENDVVTLTKSVSAG